MHVCVCVCLSIPEVYESGGAGNSTKSVFTRIAGREPRLSQYRSCPLYSHSVVGEGTPVSHANLASYWMCVWSSTVIFHWDQWGNHKTKPVALACLLALYIHFLLCPTSLHNDQEVWCFSFLLLFAVLMSRIVRWMVTSTIRYNTWLHPCFHMKHCLKKSSDMEVKRTPYGLLGYSAQDALYRLHTLLAHGNVQKNPRYI